jgi:hypothetical protein
LAWINAALFSPYFQGPLGFKHPYLFA